MLALALAGKPNAGKSTFFKAATLADVEVANYPFTTIEANRGVTAARTRCPCLDLDDRCGNDQCRGGKRYVPLELLDVAGLVPGAHEGRGLGNQFLDELMDADAILNVVDASGGTNEAGEPVEEGTYDPLAEVDFVETELDQWLAGIVDRNWETVARQSRSPSFDFEASLTEILSGLGATATEVAACFRDTEFPADPKQWTVDDRERLGRELRERTKPIVLVANKADSAPEGNLERLQAVAKPVVTATASGELALRRGAETGVVSYDPGDEEFEIIGSVSEDQRTGLERIREVMDAWGGTGVQAAINTAVYDLLDHVTVYPVENAAKWSDGQGVVLPDAFLMPRGSTPRDLAYAVHSEIGDGYLHAVNARTDRRISDNYELQEGDVIKIASTAS